MNFSDIPQLPTAHYEIDVGWDYLERQLESWDDHSNGMGGLNLDPDYQRAHVWTPAQRIAYVEYMLSGGEVGKIITWNCADWGTTYQSPVELVDGKQRLEAVRAFMRNDLSVFGHLKSEFTGHLRIFNAGFKFRVCSLKTRAEVLDLYLNINAGGTPHTKEELERVWALRKEAENA